MTMEERETGAAMNGLPVARLEAAVGSLHDEQVAFLQALVRTPSVTGQEGAAQQLVAARMRADGLETDVWEPDVDALAPHAEHLTEVVSYAGRPNVVGTLRGAGGGRSLILNAHIDTVEEGDRARWTHPPFAAEISEGRLHGRGACDMKAGLATHLFALRALREIEVRLRGDVFVESTISEEDGGAGALAAILRGYTADAAIITEPTARAVIVAQGGSLMFRLGVPGRAAHACVRDEGVSAVEKFALLHQAIIAFEARRNRALDHPLYARFDNKVPINIGVVRAGSWPSSVPEALEAEGRAGLVPGEDLHRFRDEFRDAILDAAAADPWLREHPPAIAWMRGQFAPAEVAPDAAIVRCLAGAHRRVDGVAPPLEAATYGADMRHFVLTGDTPCVMYGAGDVRLAHSVAESIDLAELRAATTTLAVAIAEWCGIAGAAESS